MRQINLQEYQESKPYPLTVSERDLFHDVLPSVSIEPVKGAGNRYRLRPGSTVGALEIDGLSVLIQPKIGIPQLLSLACYAMGVFKPQEQKLFNFQQANTLPDVLTLALNAAARRAFGRGLLRGYLTQEEALHTVRGRIRFDEQIRRRYGIPLPVELRYDEFTEDIQANRLVKAAAARLGSMGLRSSDARRGLGWIAAMLDNVSLLAFPPRRVPEVRFDRLNEHYRHAVGLARLILRHSAFESDRGVVRASGFLVDMNVLFQEFVTQALRGKFGVSARTLHSDSGGHKITLDKAGDVRLSQTFRGGRAASARSWAMPNTRTSSTGPRPTPTCIRCWPTQPRLTCRVVCLSTRRARPTPRPTMSVMRARRWRSPRLICPARLKRCSRASVTWPAR